MPSESQPTSTSVTVDALATLSFAVQIVLTRVAAEHDLSVTQLRLLGILRDRTPSMAAIADYLALDRSSVSGLIDRAERRGLVARRASANDARVTLVEIAPAGIAVGAKLAAAVSIGLSEIIGRATDADRAGIVRLADTLIADAASRNAGMGRLHVG
jgi:DNA-binding MarR family transcriptional regulator